MTTSCKPSRLSVAEIVEMMNPLTTEETIARKYNEYAARFAMLVPTDLEYQRLIGSMDACSALQAIFRLDREIKEGKKNGGERGFRR